MVFSIIATSVPKHPVIASKGRDCTSFHNTAKALDTITGIALLTIGLLSVFGVFSLPLAAQWSCVAVGGFILLGFALYIFAQLARCTLAKSGCISERRQLRNQQTSHTFT